MKTYLIALAASVAFVTAAMAAETSTPDMEPAPMTSAAPEAAPMAPAAPDQATTASVPDDKAKAEESAAQSASAPAAAAAVTSDEKAKTEAMPVAAAKAPVPKKVERVAEHHAKYHGGEGSTWKTGRNAYGFEGSYGGCQYRGHVGPNGYTIDKAC